MIRKINNAKKTILVDLDGVLNTYTGNYIENYIPPIKDGAKEFLVNLSEKYSVNIFTTRKPSLVLKWAKKNKINNISKSKSGQRIYRKKISIKKARRRREKAR